MVFSFDYCESPCLVRRLEAPRAAFPVIATVSHRSCREADSASDALPETSGDSLRNGRAAILAGFGAALVGFRYSNKTTLALTLGQHVW